MDNVLAIHNIEYGELNLYCAIKFDSKLSSKDIYDSIRSSDMCFNESFKHKASRTLAVGAKDVLNEAFVRAIPEEISKGMRWHGPDSSSDTFSWDIKPTGLSAVADENRIGLCFTSLELDRLYQRERRFIDECEIAAKIYGSNFVSTQRRLILLPLEATLESGTTTWIYPFLYLFDNKTGVLHFEFSLINSTIKPLLKPNADLFITQISNKLKIPNFPENAVFSELPQIYCSALAKCAKTHVKDFIDTISSVSMIKYDGMPLHMDTISDDTLIDLYRIIDAPVPLQTTSAYIDKARNHLAARNWSNDGFRCFIKSTGTCLSVIDLNLLEGKIKMHKEFLSQQTLSENDYYALYGKLASDLQVNTELAILVVLLEKANITNAFFEKQHMHRGHKSTQEEYNSNRFFLLSLQETCYGSVNDQIALFRQLLSHFLKLDIARDKFDSLNSNNSEKETRRASSFQNFLAVAGLFVAVVFGLPAIKETLILARSICSFLPDDIPHLTIDGVSVHLWLGISALIFIVIVRNIFRRK